MTTDSPFRGSSPQSRPLSANSALESNLGLVHKAVSSVRMPDEFREDAFQEAAIAFLEHYGDFDPTRGALSTFMWPYLRGAVTHFLRDEARFPSSTDDDVQLDCSTAGAPKKNGKSLAPAPEAMVLDREVKGFLESINRLDRELLFDLYWHDVSPSELARSMGISRQTLHVRHRRLITQGRAQISSAVLAA